MCVCIKAFNISDIIDDIIDVIDMYMILLMSTY